MGGTSHGIQSMDFDFASQPGKHECLLGLDINEDAVVIINMQGQIMMVSPGACNMWGYEKKELEGQNVSMLMPQPFNVRHNSYLQRYQDTGEARILDTVKEVVALHKDRTVFPVEICVTKLSGKGADAMFFGLVRHIPISKREIKAWVAPNGTVLCCGAMFSTLTGIPADQMVGVNVRNVVKDPSVIDAVLQRAVAAREEDFASKAIAVDMHMLNKYVDPIPCHMYMLPGGTQQTRLFVMHIVADEASDDNLLVVDEKGGIEFATVDLALSLGYTLKALMKLNLAQLLPHPVSSMHAAYLMDAPPNGPETSCREGAIVHLVSASKALVPVSLKVTQREEPAGTKHVAVVSKADGSKYLDQRRVKLRVKFDGTVEGAEPAGAAVFGFPAKHLVGRNLCDVLDVFKAWEDKTCARDMRLLLMTLLEKEDAIPGCSWRAKLSHPDPKLGRPPKHVILQAEVADKDEPKTALLGGGGKPEAAGRAGAGAGAGEDLEPRVHLLLWKTDALVGSMQMDSKLRVVACDPLTGLILGQPSALMLRKPLHRLLNTGGCKTWESLVAARPSTHKPRSRDDVTIVSKPSKARAFEARHPDGGSVRVVMQGVVVTDIADGRENVHVTVRADASHPQTVRTDLLTALGLDDLEREERASKEGSQLSSSSSEESADDRPSDKALSKRRLAGLAAGDEPSARGGAGKNGGGAFVASWVRAMPDEPPEEEVRASGKLKKPRATFADEASRPDDWQKMAQEMPDEAGMGGVDGEGRPRRKRGEAKKLERTKEPKKRGEKDADIESETSVSDGASSQGEDASAYSGSAMTSVCEETLVDQRRAKVLRKLCKLVHSQAIREPLERVRVSTYWILIFAIVMRVIAFIVLLLISAEQKDYNRSSYYTAIAADVSQVLVEEVQTVAYCSNLTEAQRTHICAKLNDVFTLNAMITKHVDEMEEAHYDTFLGHEPGARKLHDASTYAVWSNDAPTFNSTLYMDTSPRSVQAISYGLFQLGNSFIAAVREMQYQMKVMSSADIFRSRAYNFVTINGPNALFEAYQEALDNLMEATRLHIDGFNTALVVLLVVEGCVLLPLLSWWMWAAVAASENLRLLRWCCLSTLPAPVRLSLATRPAKVSDGDDDASDVNDSSDNDDAEAAQLAQKSAAAPDSASPVGVQPTYTRHATFVGPLLLWMAALVGVYAASLAAIAAMRPPVGMLNTAMRVLYRLSRLRMATMMAVTQQTDLLKDTWRRELNSTARDLETDYNTLMYGGQPTTLENAKFFDEVVASTFYSRTLADVFFETVKCLRTDLSTCYDEASEWYEATHHGLDTMMRRVLDEAYLLLRDNNTVLTHENPRARAMYYIADRDLYEGMHTSAEIYVEDANAGATFIVTLQLAMLVAVVLLAAAYVRFVMWPYLRLQDEEADKVAGILSHVPDEVDVVSHTKKQLRRGLPKAAAKKAAVAPAPLQAST
uniref:PAS domain-containing protein n=1 Tax=Chlamydomonas euryale TaxID=1486919 RepID=A0A7R9VSG4_9CHLO